MSTFTYTVVLPDGTTSTRESKTQAFTHAVVKFTSAETMARRIGWAIDRIKELLGYLPQNCEALPPRLASSGGDQRRERMPVS